MIIERRVRTAGEALSVAREITQGWKESPTDPEEVWYRGQQERRYKLQPGLYRPKVQALNYNEINLFERFKSLSKAHIRRNLEEWEWYFLGQHHGLPTRLLDWSESLFTALYFAIADLIYCRTRLELDAEIVADPKDPVYDDESPSVWILDAGTLNKVAHNEDWVYVPGGRLTNRYLPDSIAESCDDENKHPLAIYPPRANTRIAAQQGLFTIHGHQQAALDDLALQPELQGQLRLACLVFDRANVGRLWDEIRTAGVNRLTMFPDIDSVAVHVKWTAQSAKPY